MPALNLQGIRPDAVETVRDFAQGAVDAFKEHLIGVHLAGSILTKDYLPGRSDINFVFVFQRFYPDFFNLLVKLGKEHGHKGVSTPLSLTQSYIDTSLDAFPLEFLNLKLIHRTLHGRDTIADLKIDRADLRLQCERELKSHFLQLRQAFLHACNDQKALRHLLFSAHHAYVPVIRGVLHLLGKEAPRERIDAIGAIEEATGIPMHVMKDIARIKAEDLRVDIGSARSLYMALYDLGAALGEKVDQMQIQA